MAGGAQTAAPLIAVWGPKGGVGKTVIAASLAMHLCRRFPEGVLLADLDAGKADVAPLLKTALRPSILEYSTSGRTVAHPHGLQVLPGPPRLVDEGLLTGELADAVLCRAVESHSAVVADLDSDLRDSTLIALERADAVLLVTTPDLLSIYAARRFIQEAEMIGLNMSRYRLVINRTSELQQIPDSEILDLIGIALAGRIPDVPGLTASINRGMITAVIRSNTDFSLAVALVAEKLSFAGIPPAAAGGRGRGGLGGGGPAPGSWASASALSQVSGLLPALKRWWQSL